MDRSDIEAALKRAEKGIEKYRHLMATVADVNVSADQDFQRSYNGFYRVQRRQQTWYQSYYRLMETLKLHEPPALFDDVLDQIYAKTGCYEPSFSSKLVATLNPDKPIWDIHVLGNTGVKAPSYSNTNKLELAKTAYRSMEDWYARFLTSADGKLCVKVFDSIVLDPEEFTDLKKVDFILWQLR